MINTWRGEIHTGFRNPVLGRKGLERKGGGCERQKNAKCER
jgi:hypothetical protein